MSYSLQNLFEKKELKKLLILATPVLIAQLSQMGMSFVDTIMAAKVSTVDMASVAVGASVWIPIILFGAGFLMVLAPIIAHLTGESKEKRIYHFMNQGFWIVIALSILLMAVFLNIKPILGFITDDPELIEKSYLYIYYIQFGVPAFLGFVALRSLNEGLASTRPAMIVGVLGLMINIPINYGFVYGEGGLPALGGPGCGLATAIVFWFMFLAMLFIILKGKKHKLYQVLKKPHRASLYRITDILRLGTPIALSLLCETGLFCVSSLLIAGISTQAVAAHQIAINISSMIFMIPLSLGTALSIRVAYFLGKKDNEGVLTAIKTGFNFGITLAVIFSILTWIFRYEIARIYTTEPALIEATVGLLIFCAIYQIPDTIQLLGNSTLRGYRETFWIMIYTLISYWFIAMPVGYILGRTNLLGFTLGATGFWIGFIVGLTTAATLLVKRVFYLNKKLRDMNLSS